MVRAFEYADSLKSGAADFLKQSPAYELLRDHQAMTENAHKVLKKNFSPQHRELLKKTPMVFLVANGLDACTLKVPGAENESVVAVGARYSLLLYLMTRASLWAGLHFEELNSRVFQRMARSAVALFAAFTFRRNLEKGDLAGDWFFGSLSDDTPNDYENVTITVFGGLCFTICHELAHIKLGHLSESDLNRMTSNRAPDGLTFFDYQQSQEFAADLEGARLFYEGCPAITLQHSAPLTVCYTIGLLDYLKQVLLSADARSSTHPHGMNRASQLLNHFRPIMDKAEITHAAITCGVVEGIVKEVVNGGGEVGKILRDIGIKKGSLRGNGPTSFPTLEVLYQVQKRSKRR